MKKVKTSLIVLTEISLICLTFFVFSPSLKAHAMFSDTTSIDMGIQLELGTVSLATKDTVISNAVNFTEGDSVLIASSKLINDGSLSGKLAYKIDVTNEDGIVLEPEKTKNMSVSISFNDEAQEVTASSLPLNTNSFTFAKDSSSNDIILEPDPVDELIVTVNYKSSVPPTENEELKVTVTFRLIQSNAADANAEMFSDEESLTNTVTLVPKVIEEKSYWPAANTFTFENSSNKNLTYSLEKMNMVFSEVYDEDNSNVKQIKNLNKAVLYIQIPKDEELDSFNIDIKTSDSDRINIYNTVIDEENHGLKITFNLEDSYDSSKQKELIEYNKLYVPLNLKLQVKKHQNSTYANINNINFFATRLVLSSDILSSINVDNFEPKEILLSNVENFITIKQLEGGPQGSVNKSNFKDFQWTEETVALEVKGGEPLQIVSLLNLNTAENPNKKFSLWLNSNETLNSAFLNVKILGDAGNMLVISRTLKNGAPTSSTKATTQSLNMRSMSVPLIVEETEEPTEQSIGSEKSVEVPDSAINKTTPDEQSVDSSVEESDTEQVTDETEEIEKTEEVLDSSLVESAAESIEEPDRSAPVEPINNE